MIPGAGSRSCSSPRTARRRSEFAMIAVENVSKQYGKHVALAPTTLAVRPGATTVLIGPSGCGKSTLLRIMLGLIRPDSGRVLFGERELTPQNADALRHG